VVEMGQPLSMDLSALCKRSFEFELKTGDEDVL
jgi:hypothetical protein